MNDQVRFTAIAACCCIAIVPCADAASVQEYTLYAEASYAASPATGTEVQQALAVEAEATVSMSESFQWRFGARASYDFAQRLRPNRDDDRFFQYANGINQRPGIGDSGDIELRELYLEWHRDARRVRLGRQQAVWSSLDDISMFVLNPSDFHEFVLSGETERQRPQWGLYLDVPAAGWRLESAVFLDNTVHDVPDPGSWFEFTAPQFRFGAPPEQATSATEFDTELPDPLRDATYALRGSRSFGNTKIVFAGLTGNEYEAVAEPRPGATGPVLLRKFPRRHLAQIAMETGLGSAVIRGELVMQFNKVLNVREEGTLSMAEVDVLALGFGVDLNLPRDVFMNVQILLDRVQDAPETLIKPQRNDLLTVTLQRSFLYDSLIAKWRWYRDLEFRDSLSQVSISYAPSDATTIELLGAWFTGSPLGRFGQFAERDLVRLTLGYSF
ncbi:MAG: DUF1302 family protein [Pseudomonadota bacterium]